MATYTYIILFLRISFSVFLPPSLSLVDPGGLHLPGRFHVFGRRVSLPHWRRLRPYELGQESVKGGNGGEGEGV